MFRAHVLIISRSKLHYTASGIITPIGVMFRAHVLIIRRSKLRYTTSGIITPIGVMMPDDDEHMCTKHVEAWNKLIVKQTFCASSWLITEINKLRCTVSKMSKNVNGCWLTKRTDKQHEIYELSCWPVLLKIISGSLVVITKQQNKIFFALLLHTYLYYSSAAEL